MSPLNLSEIKSKAVIAPVVSAQVTRAPRKSFWCKTCGHFVEKSVCVYRIISPRQSAIYKKCRKCAVGIKAQTTCLGYYAAEGHCNICSMEVDCQHLTRIRRGVKKRYGKKSKA